MFRAMQCAVLLCLLSIAALCGFVCWAVHSAVEEQREFLRDAQAQLTATEAETVASEHQLVGVVGSSAAALNAALGEVTSRTRESKAAVADINHAAAGLNQAAEMLVAPCGAGKPCGTIADVNRTLESIRLATGQVTAFSLREQSKLDQANQQETEIAAATKDDLAKLGTAIDSVGALAADADLKKSLGNLNTTSGAIAGMATDTQQYWHGVLHPKWPRRIWNGVTGVGIAAAKFFIP